MLILPGRTSMPGKKHDMNRLMLSQGAENSIFSGRNELVEILAVKICSKGGLCSLCLKSTILSAYAESILDTMKPLTFQQNIS